MNHQLFYLGAPYSHANPLIKKARHLAVNQTLLQLKKAGRLVYSPLTHNIPIDEMGIHGDWQTWSAIDHLMLEKCDGLIILKLPGWENSKGLAAEMALAKKLGKIIEEKEMDESLYLAAEKIAEFPHELQSFMQEVQIFFQERDWDKFHSPKNLAMNTSVEAAEILEHFRWLTEEESSNLRLEQKQKVKDEIGDTFTTLLHLCFKLGINPLQAARDKLQITAKRYPADLCKGKCQKYTEYSLQ